MLPFFFFFFQQMPRYPLFYPFALTLKHPPFLGFAPFFFFWSQVKFHAPSLCLYSITFPLPHLPACCFPREVNLLSAGSMNRTGLELRPTHLPNIARVLCIAPARLNPPRSVSFVVAGANPGFQNSQFFTHYLNILYSHNQKCTYN